MMKMKKLLIIALSFDVSNAFITPQTFIVPPTQHTRFKTKQSFSSSSSTRTRNYISNLHLFNNIKKSKNIENIDDGSIDVYVTAICSLTDDLKQRDEEIEELKGEIENLEQTLKKKNHQGDQLSEFYPMFSEQMAKKEEEIAKLKEQLDKFNVTSAGTDTLTTSAVSNDDKSVLFASPDDHEIIKALEGKLKQYEKENDALSQDVINKEVEIMEYKQSHQDEIKEKEKEATLMKREVQSMTDKLRNLEQKLSSAQQQKPSTSSSSKDETESNKEKDAQIANLQNKLSNLQDQMRVKQKESNQKYMVLQKEMELIVTSSKELRIQLEERSKELEMIKNKEDYWQERLQQMQKELEGMKSAKSGQGQVQLEETTLQTQKQSEAKVQPEVPSQTQQSSNHIVVEPMISQQKNMVSKRYLKTKKNVTDITTSQPNVAPSLPLPHSTKATTTNTPQQNVKVKRVVFAPNDAKKLEW